MHVGLNLVFLEEDSGGAGTYARELMRALIGVEPDIRISAWVGRGAPADLLREDFGGHVEWIRLPMRSTGGLLHVPVELLALGLAARRRGCDVLHGVAYSTPVAAPDIATVVTILDLTWRTYPRSVSLAAAVMFRLFVSTALRRADRLLAVSETACRDIVARLGVDPARIDVTPLGVSHRGRATPTSTDALRKRLGVPTGARVLLNVGQQASHKNTVALVEAMTACVHRDAVIVIAGRSTPYGGEIVARAERLGVRHRVFLPGFVSDPDLEGLYALADAVVLPSLSEGFGLPVLEAMARGVPVACSNVGPFPEVAGDAALMFDPLDPRSIASAIDALLGDAGLAGRLVELGHARARAHTWERTGRLTLAAYRRAIVSRPGRR